MEDYKEKFEKLIQRIDDLIVNGWIDEKVGKAILKDFTLESEDEKIRKEIVEYIKIQQRVIKDEGHIQQANDIEKWIVWLEKQGAQTSTDKVEPKFKVGDIIRPKGSTAEYTIESIYGECYHGKGWGLSINCDDDYELVEQTPTDKVEPKFHAGDFITDGKRIFQIEETIWERNNKNDGSTYCESLIVNLRDGNTYANNTDLKEYHLWTIQDAKDGDVLTWGDNKCIALFKEIYNKHSFKSHGCIGACTKVFENWGFHDIENAHPATKEQCDLLFSKMKEAGYEWDSEKKEVRKIEIKDDVLSRFAFYQYDDDTIYLSSVFVEECNRKHGYGTKILKAAEEVAKTFGVSKIRLKVERNTWMEEWYKKNGYEYLSSDGEYNWLEKQGEHKQHLELKAGHWYFCHQAFCERADILTVKEGETFKCEKDGIVKGLIIKEPEKYFREISTPSDKVEPKFKVGDTIVEKDLDECGCGTIVNIKDGKYIFDDGCFICIKEQERWQLVGQKSTNKVEPKFKVGDWIISSEGTLRHIVAVDKTGYETNEGWLTHDDYEKSFHLWTIKDAKDGDVLAAHECLVLFKEIDGWNIKCYCTYHFMNNQMFHVDTLQNKNAFSPATKEQRDLLFQKIHEAGYEWDAEKKELKKIVQKPKIYDSMDDLIADALIEEIENSGLDDSSKHNRIFWIKSHRQNPDWGEEDENILNHIICDIESLKEQVYCRTLCNEEITWLKSLKERYIWKPSDEQMDALNIAIGEANSFDTAAGDEAAEILTSLYEQLEKLKQK